MNKQATIYVLLICNDGNGVVSAPKLYNEDPRPSEEIIIEGVS
jgi:hypothetical protein